MGGILFKEDAPLVRWASDGQYLSAHLDFDSYLQLDLSKVTAGVLKLLRENSISLTQCEGQQELDLIRHKIVIHEVHHKLGGD